MKRPIIWTAVQACGDCGAEAFRRTGRDGIVLCEECGHEHPMDRVNLDAGEEFTWTDDGRLSVTAYAVEGDES